MAPQGVSPAENRPAADAVQTCRRTRDRGHQEREGAYPQRARGPVRPWRIKAVEEERAEGRDTDQPAEPGHGHQHTLASAAPSGRTAEGRARQGGTEAQPQSGTHDDQSRIQPDFDLPVVAHHEPDSH